MPKTKAKVLQEAQVVVQELVEKVVQEKIDQEEERKPGSIVRGQKVPWSWKDCEKVFPVVEFTPWTSQPVTWNGLTKYFIANQSQLMPSCFKDIYLESMRRQRRQVPIVVSTGVVDRGAEGPLPPQ